VTFSVLAGIYLLVSYILPWNKMIPLARRNQASRLL
jgi:galactitol-specific phosphotransferase system IIC component